VLLKVFGLTLVAHSVVPILNGLITALAVQSNGGFGYNNFRAGGWYLFFTGAIPAVLGALLMWQSRWVANRLFADEKD